MKEKGKQNELRLAYFKNLFENAKNRYQETDARLEKYMKQYRGDYTIDNSNEAAGIVRNITYEIIESQLSSDIPLPKVDTECYSERRDRNAKTVERLCTALRARLPFEEMNDIDERYTYIYGSSVWYVEWENSEGEVKIHCISPRDFIPQPNITSIRDMQYCFLVFTTTKEELLLKYGLSEDCTELFEEDTAEDTVKVVIAFYKGEDGEIGQFIFSGDAILSDIPDYYKRKMSVCPVCQREEGECECKSPSFVSRNVDTESLDIGEYVNIDLQSTPITVDVKYYTPKDFPIVIRKNTSSEKSLLGQSDCEYIRPQQQAINKIESRIMQKLLRAGITPIMPEDASVALNNSVFGQVIKMKPGESAAQYGKVDTTPDISQDVLEAERLYDQAKRTLGISDAFQGIDNNKNESGYARQLRISQASGRLESKKKMKYTAYAELDRLIFLHYLAFADMPKRLVFKDAYGRIHNAEFKRQDFLEYDNALGEFYYDDGYLFSVDLNGGAEYQREALWERNLENLKAGALGDPSSPVTLLRYWQAQERAHYPFARENVEYFKNLDEEGGIPNDTQPRAFG